MILIIEEMINVLAGVITAILVFACAIFAATLIRDILRSQELKDKRATRRLVRALDSLPYLKDAPEMIKKRSFLSRRRNKGKSPCAVNEVIIDEGYDDSKKFYI